MHPKPNEYYRGVRPEMLALLGPNPRRVLDVGCAEGGFGEGVKRKTGAEVWGIEMEPTAAAVAETRLDRVFNGTFEAVVAQLPVQGFDYVCFNDVLEHLYDPFEVLRQTKSLLGPNGRVIASIPNVRYMNHLFNYLVRRDWQYKSSGILDFTHIRFFTRKSLIRMFTECGYDVEHIGGVGLVPWQRFYPFNVFTLGLFSDSRPVQYAVVAKPNGGVTRP